MKNVFCSKCWKNINHSAEPWCPSNQFNHEKKCTSITRKYFFFKVSFAISMLSGSPSPKHDHGFWMEETAYGYGW